MNRTEINLVIDYWLQYYGGGKGKSYWYIDLNSERLNRKGLTLLRKVAQEGDMVRLDICSPGRKPHFIHRNVKFTIENDYSIITLQKQQKAETRQWNAKYRNHRRDSQREKAYTWEDKLGIRGQKEVPVNEIQDLIDEVLGTFGFEDHGHSFAIKKALKKRSYYATSKKLIMLALEWGTERECILHELAHALVSLMGLWVPHHGKEFMGILMDVYEIFLGIDRQEMLDMADHLGVKYCQVSY